jgi:hypothetical protein
MGSNGPLWHNGSGQASPRAIGVGIGSEGTGR